ncbi:MAG: hypothetical protein WA152_00600 [Microgenomates group bacterium]
MVPKIKPEAKQESGNKKVSGGDPIVWTDTDNQSDRERNSEILKHIPTDIADEVKRKIRQEKSNLHYDADPTRRI